MLVRAAAAAAVALVAAACGSVRSSPDGGSSDASADGAVDARLPVLSVERAGTGTGTVTSDPPGIQCGDACRHGYPPGTAVTLTAMPASDAVFLGWSGGGCGGTEPCTVEVIADVTVVAEFAPAGFVASGGWTCATGADCQDVYDVTVPADTSVLIAVNGVSGDSVLRLAAFAPGVPLDGANLLTGLAQDRRCRAHNAGDSVAFRAVAAGRYRIAVGRDWATSGGASGAYTLVVTADRPLAYEGRTVDDGVTGAGGTRCGFSYTTDGGWSCPSGVSCQDVADVIVLEPTPLTITIEDVTGGSVVRLAVFHGADLDTVNLLNGHLADRRCGGLDDGDTATTPSPVPAGTARIAVGRDGALSSGTAGTFRATVTTPDAPLTLAAIAFSVPTELGATTCP